MISFKKSFSIIEKMDDDFLFLLEKGDITMVRGSTPRHIFYVKDADNNLVDFSTATKITVTYKQDDLMEITKDLDDGVNVGEDGNVIVNLTKDDTMRLFPGKCSVQIEAEFGGNVIISNCGRIDVKNRLKSGE